MPTKREVWLAADRLREKSEPVSVRSVRAALPYGGSYRDIGPHLADWKAERSYTRVIELSGLPDHIQTQLARAGTTLWQAALQDATKFLSAEREQARAVARSCGQTGFPNQLMSDSTLLFGEGSGASRVDERRGMGVLRAFPD